MKAILVIILASLSASLLHAQDVQIENELGIFKAHWNIANGESAIVIIPGSGPVDRFGNAGSMKGNNLAYLSDSLQSRGISVLSTDKLFAEESLPSNTDSLIFEDFVTLANSWVDVAKDSGYKHVYVMGHSQGSLTAMILGNRRDDLAGVISLCGAGQRIHEILKVQLAVQFPPDQMEGIRAALDSVAMGESPKSPSPLLVGMFNERQYPFLKSWMDQDPCEYARNIQCPLLILTGENDIQVSVSEGELLYNCNPNAQNVVIPTMGHMLKKSVKIRMLALQDYGKAERPVLHELPETIDSFIQSH